MKLDIAFYQKEDVTMVAQELLGKVLCVKDGDILCAARIVETEAYSFREQACHAYNNRLTRRTETLFAEGGTAYVYLCYGIHRLFNVVTNRKGIAEAVLVRAVEPMKGIEMMKLRRNQGKVGELGSGPGKLSQALGIELHHNQHSLQGNEVWIEDDRYRIEPEQIIEGTRIGVDYAGEDAKLPWRYGIRDNPCLSRPFV